MCIAVLHTLVAGFMARSQYPEGPVTGHLSTGFSWFPCAYKRMLRWFRRLRVATSYFSCSPPNLNFLNPYFILMYMDNNHCHRATAHLQLNILLLLLLLFLSLLLLQENFFKGVIKVYIQITIAPTCFGVITIIRERAV